MLEKIKTALRISHDELDGDLQNNIDACLLDLERVGIEKDFKTSLLLSAVELYCKWIYDYQGKGELFLKHYEKLRNALSLSEEYRKNE